MSCPQCVSGSPGSERVLCVIISQVPRPGRAWKRLIAPMALIIAWDVGVVLAYEAGIPGLNGISIQYSLFGTAIALFLGFMVNASYARWWEARTLWGSVVNNSRSLGRQVVTSLDQPSPDARPELVGEMVRAQIAYVHALRTSLRKQDVAPEVGVYLTEDARAVVTAATNVPNAVLTHIGALLSEAYRRGMVTDISRQRIESTLTVLSDAQGGLERIKNTPLPVQYRFLPSFFSRVFAVILPFAIVRDLHWFTPLGSGLVALMFLLAVQVGNDLAEPFVDDVHDVPMTTICRTIEIDLLQMIGQEAPDIVKPVEAVLW